MNNDLPSDDNPVSARKKFQFESSSLLFLVCTKHSRRKESSFLNFQRMVSANAHSSYLWRRYCHWNLSKSSFLQTFESLSRYSPHTQPTNITLQSSSNLRSIRCYTHRSQFPSKTIIFYSEITLEIDIYFQNHPSGFSQFSFVFHYSTLSYTNRWHRSRTTPSNKSPYTNLFERITHRTWNFSARSSITMD